MELSDPFEKTMMIMDHCYVERWPRDPDQTAYTVIYALCKGPSDPLQAYFSRRTLVAAWDPNIEIACNECSVARLVAKANGLGPTDTKALFELLASSLREPESESESDRDDDDKRAASVAK